MSWKIGKTVELNNSVQIATYRQCLQKENKIAAPNVKKAITALESQLYRKNGYLHLHKGKKVLDDEDEKEKTGKGTVYAFDQCKRDEDPQHGYNQMTKRESFWHKAHKDRPDARVVQDGILVSSQAYGWREPIDDMRTGFARCQVCKKTFFDVGHLS